MDRRNFLKNAAAAAAGFRLGGVEAGFRTRHLVWLINGGGSRKREWYERPDFAPSFARLAREGFTYVEDHNDTVASHQRSWTELITGNPRCSAVPAYPTLLHYVRKAHADAASKYFYLNGVNRYRGISLAGSYLTSHPGYGEETRPALLTMSGLAAQRFDGMGLTVPEQRLLEEFVVTTLGARACDFNLKNNPVPREPMVSEAAALALVPALLQAFKPRIIVVQMAGHDVAHESYADYEQVCRTTDELLGKLLDFIQADTYFSRNTSVVVRPEVGRDDEVNMLGELNHSMGYGQCHRSASIFWGPDFKCGTTNLVVNRTDMVPTLARIFNVDTPGAMGRVRRELFLD